MKSRALCLACDFHSAEANFNCKHRASICQVVQLVSRIKMGVCRLPACAMQLTSSNYITIVLNDTTSAKS